LKPLHSLLRRQLKGLSLDELPPRILTLLGAVNTAYQQFDEDRTMLERSMELSSQELLQANAQSLAASEDRFSATFNQAPVGIAHVSTEGRFLLVNRKLCEMFGASMAELKDKHADDFSHIEDRHVTREQEARMRAGEIREFCVEKRYSRADGTVVWVKLTVARVRGAGSLKDYDIAIWEDITERIRVNTELWRMARFDSLSGLPNRYMLKDRVTGAVARAQRLNQPLAFALFDLDRFKEVNDALGHLAGDELLRQLSARLVGLVRNSDTLARLGGDEFTVILEGCATIDDVRTGATRLLSLFEEPFLIRGHQLYASCSIGVSVFPQDGKDFEQLLRQADVAMYAAKRAGGAAVRLYSPELHAGSPDGFTMHSELRQALERGEFELHYQPRVAIATGEVVGLEALVRWRHPQRGIVPPYEFIPLAEETGLIEPIGIWVIDTACSYLMGLRQRGGPDLSVSVNLSPRQFRNRGLIATVAKALSATGLPPSRLVLEITETVMMERTGLAREVLDALVATGVQVAIDDFGTGYASLSYLRRFPVHEVKIDREFVRDIESDEDDAAIVRAIVQLTHSLGLIAVAEGVETEAQLEFLAGLGCDAYQGFLHSRPLPVAELEQLLLSPSATPS
jgi:diguanylate cyclase (GGDEF)-like protein/PAS domain S-box-containing protein